MALSIYTGATESGKSWHVKNHVLDQFKRVVVFDPVSCFEGDLVCTAPSDKQIVEIFRKFKEKTAFKIIIRTDRTSNPESVFNKVVELASALGRKIPKNSEKSERVQVVVDEASTMEIMSSSYQSKPLKNLVCRGRHDNVDTHLIAQDPMSIHRQLRSQATKMCTFFLNNANDVPVLISCFSRKFVGKIGELPKYWRMEWTDNGIIQVFDDKNKSIEQLTKNSRENPGKRKVLNVA